MTRTMTRVVVLAGLLAMAACTPTRPPQELVDARAAYARAYVGPAAEANSGGLHDARSALDEAEAKFAEDPGSEEVRHLAYVAHRRVLVAETNARTTIAATQRAQAEQALVEMRARAKLNEPPRAEDKGKARVGTTP